MTFWERPPDFTPCVRHSLMAHSTASEPVVSRRTFFSGSGRMEASFSGRREGARVRGSLRGDGVHDLLAAVAGVGDQHAGGPVHPLVAPGVEDLEAFGAVPDNGRLAAHGDGLAGVEALQDGQRLGYRQIRHDPAEGRLDARDGPGDEAVFSDHNLATLYSPV